jgi:hypothetical protein
MVHRLALFFGAVGAAGILALALNLGGFAGAPTAANADTAAAPPAATAAPASTKTVIDKVYVEAAPKPDVVHVNKPPRNVAGANSARPRGDGRERDGDERERGESGERGEHESD